MLGGHVSGTFNLQLHAYNSIQWASFWGIISKPKKYSSWPCSAYVWNLVGNAYSYFWTLHLYSCCSCTYTCLKLILLKKCTYFSSYWKIYCYVFVTYTYFNNTKFNYSPKCNQVSVDHDIKSKHFYYLQGFFIPTSITAPPPVYQVIKT